MNLAKNDLGKKDVTILVLILVAVVIVSTYLLLHSSEDPDDTNLRELLYDVSFLGYNSTSWTMVSIPITLPDDMLLPETTNLSLSIYHYETVDITDPDDYGVLVGKIFPEINLSNMKISTDFDPDYQMPYLTISNDSVGLKVLRSGAMVYRDKDGLQRESDEIKSEENATKIAFQFLKDHGGVPDDIRDTEVIPLYVIPDEGAIFYGQYLVKIYRDVSDCSVISSSLCNEISIYIDASNKEVIGYEWHWPDLRKALTMDDLPEAREIIAFYGMAQKGKTVANITAAHICYYVPPNIQESAYDTRVEDYYLAPYLVVTVEDGRFYILGLILPEAF